jgi:hypothetical protein
MDGLASSSDPKTALMNEVRQQSAVLNARQLIEVFRPYAPSSLIYLASAVK